MKSSFDEYLGRYDSLPLNNILYNYNHRCWCCGCFKPKYDPCNSKFCKGVAELAALFEIKEFSQLDPSTPRRKRH